jgi:hypothetical protein
MKRIVFMVMVMAGLLYAGPLAALDNTGPKIEVTEMRYDFGKVIQGTRVEHVFEIRNTGSEQLVIEKVQPS